MTANERHVFILAGISGDTFKGIGAKATLEDPTLTYFVHAHPLGTPPWEITPCNTGCEFIRNGKLEKVQPMLVESTTEQSGDGNV